MAETPGHDAQQRQYPRFITLFSAHLLQSSSKMEHPPPSPLGNSADGQQVPSKIEPCVSILRDHGDSQPGVFHLLRCGHIVAVDEEDTRCGINCQETVNIGRNSTFLTTSDLLLLPLVQRPNYLYCEVCQGIPWDNYTKLLPPSDDLSHQSMHMPRRCLALTRGEIVAAIRVPDAGVDVLLASPFPSPHYYAHNLRCGHRVWCASSHNCAQNCHDDRPCNADGVRRLLMKQSDVVFCEECVLRAERVHTRFEQAAAERSLGLKYDHRRYG